MCVRVLAVKPSIAKLCHKKQVPQLRSSPAKTLLALTILLATWAKTGHGKPGKSWNLRILFSRPGKSWKISNLLKLCLVY